MKMARIAVYTFISLLIVLSSTVSTWSKIADENTVYSWVMDFEAEGESEEKLEELKKDERKLQPSNNVDLSLYAGLHKYGVSQNQNYTSPYLRVIISPPEQNV